MKRFISNKLFWTFCYSTVLHGYSVIFLTHFLWKLLLCPVYLHFLKLWFWISIIDKTSAYIYIYVQGMHPPNIITIEEKNVTKIILAHCLCFVVQKNDRWLRTILMILEMKLHVHLYIICILLRNYREISLNNHGTIRFYEVE